MWSPHARTVVQARSCLAALADGASTPETSSAYEQVLIALDWIHGDDVPALQTDDLTYERSILFEGAFCAIAGLLPHGVSELQVELLLAMLGSAHDREFG